MRSHLITNLFLLLLIIGLSVFLFNNGEDRAEIKTLSSLSANNIHTINIYHNQREIIINKIEQEWRLTKPVSILANQFSIKTLLNLLSIESNVHYNTDGLELEKYGLDKIDTHIRFNDTQIDFGIINPINNLRYVKLNNKLHLINDNYYPLISSQIGTLIASELLPRNTKITKLILPKHTLYRDENDLWQSADNISGDNIVETIYQWRHKQAFAVHNYIARESLGNILVYLEGGDSPVRFTITDVDPWLIIARPDIGIEYHFNLEDYDALLTPDAIMPPSQDLNDESKPESIYVSPDEFINTIKSQ